MKQVDLKLYTRKYFLTSCTGHQEFHESHGKKMEERLLRVVRKVKEIRNLYIIDIGCGRGELVYWAAKNGAKEAIGIDYAQAVVRLANNARKKWRKDIQQRTYFKLMDAKKLQFENNKFDIIFFTEVLEHMYHDELIAAFREMRRVLKDNGILIVHTAPSKYFNDFTYKYWCYPMSTLLVKVNNFISSNNYPNILPPSEIRNEYEKIMHVNEPNYFLFKTTF